MVSVLQATHNIDQYLNKIDFLPMDDHAYNLYEYLKFELYGIVPSYLVDCDDAVFIAPKYFKWVLKGIKDLISVKLD
jgi:hypothetical protein